MDSLMNRLKDVLPEFQRFLHERKFTLKNIYRSMH